MSQGTDAVEIKDLSKEVEAIAVDLIEMNASRSEKQTMIDGRTIYVTASYEASMPHSGKFSGSMSFGHALEALKAGKRVARSGWNGKGMWLETQVPDVHSKMTRPYVFISVPAGSTSQFGDDHHPEVDRVAWLPSQTDMFAEDWAVIA